MVSDGGQTLVSGQYSSPQKIEMGANMDLKFSLVTRKGPITIVTLSRPEVYNALHTDAHFELQKVFDDFSADPEQWVAIVTGAGDKAFCAGNDLKWQAAGATRLGQGRFRRPHLSVRLRQADHRRRQWRRDGRRF
jgi:enoyl-CoA hydratase/carnithine racemase